MNPLIQVKQTTAVFLTAVALACFGLSPAARAVLPSPSPDGGYPNENTAEGTGALAALTTGAANTATGAGALFKNTTGNLNTANGEAALYHNIDGVSNTAIGASALLTNNHGGANTAIGANALLNDTTTSGFQGGFNTAVGWEALSGNTTGFNNTALGIFSGSSVTTASNVICIGEVAGANVNNSCYIGNIYSNIQPVVGTNPDVVTITSDGRLGRANISSRRYKHDIQPMDKASEVLFALKPVSFHYNKEYDATQTIAFGLIAEEVAEVDPDLVGRNAKGQPESVRYEQINAMLLNEFLKEHKAFLKEQRKVANLENDFQVTVAQQKKEIAALTVSVKEQASQIQKVTDQLEASKPAPQVVNNP
jgi:hypothetical protein